jgi:hypothetical protein
VDDFRKKVQLATLEQLTLENSSLEQCIVHYQQHWYLALETLKKAREALLLIHDALKQCLAEREGLALLTNEMNSRYCLHYDSAGWI